MLIILKFNNFAPAAYDIFCTIVADGISLNKSLPNSTSSLAPATAGYCDMAKTIMYLFVHYGESSSFQPFESDPYPWPPKAL